MTDSHATRADADVERLHGFLRDYTGTRRRRPAPIAADEVLASIFDPADREYVTAIAAAAAQAYRNPRSSQTRLLMQQARAAASGTRDTANPEQLYQAAASIAVTFATEQSGDEEEHQDRGRPSRGIENAMTRTATMTGPISDEPTENLSPIRPLDLARDVRESLVGRNVRDSVEDAVRDVKKSVQVTAELFAALSVSLDGFRDDAGRLPQVPSGASPAQAASAPHTYDSATSRDFTLQP
jgi:hypothetical protein